MFLNEGQSIEVMLSNNKTVISQCSMKYGFLFSVIE